jgi:hypothetical protein
MHITFHLVDFTSSYILITFPVTDANIAIKRGIIERLLEKNNPLLDKLT